MFHTCNDLLKFLIFIDFLDFLIKFQHFKMIWRSKKYLNIFRFAFINFQIGQNKFFVQEIIIVAGDNKNGRIRESKREYV